MVQYKCKLCGEKLPFDFVILDMHLHREHFQKLSDFFSVEDGTHPSDLVIISELKTKGKIK